MDNKQKAPTIDESSGDLIESAMMRLVYSEPFYANLLMNMKRFYVKETPTIGVNVTDTVNLYVNPYFWKSLKVEQQVDILKHEVGHVVNNHFARFRNLDPHVFEKLEKKVTLKENATEEEKKQAVRSLVDRINGMSEFQTLNQAADYAINEYLPNLPKKMKFFDKDGNMVVEPEHLQDGTKNPNAGKPIEGEPCLVASLKKQFPDVVERKNMEYYHEFLKQKQEEQQPQNGGTRVITIDDHSMWSEGEADEEYITEKVRKIVNKAVEQTQQSRGAGSIPHEFLKAIEDLNNQPKNWKQDLRKFVAKTAEIVVDSTRKKRNRRYGITQPGTKVYPRLHLALLTDFSGSVGDEEAIQFFAEMYAIARFNIKITHIEFDAQVNYVGEFTKKSKPKFNGRGGTHFKPAFEEAMKHDIDGIICFTDAGDYSNDCPRPKVPVLWALVGNDAENILPYKWGYRTKVEVKKKK